MVRRAFACASVVVLLSAACGSSPSDDPGALPEPEVAELCQALCQRDLGCDPTVDVARCNSSCGTRYGSDALRADTMRDALTCLAARACGVSDDTCELCTPTPTHETFEQLCRDRLASCAVDLDQQCGGGVCMFRPSVVDDLTGCLPAGVSCSDATACLRDVLATSGP